MNGIVSLCVDLGKQFSLVSLYFCFFSTNRECSTIGKKKKKREIFVKKVFKTSSHSKKKVRNTIELKNKIIQKYNSGVKSSKMGHLYRKLPFTISSIVAKMKAQKRLMLQKV